MPVRAISSRPAGPLGGALALVLGALLLGAALVVGAVLLAVILGMAALAAALLGLRLWWAGRRERPVDASAAPHRDGVVIEGRYTRRKTRTARHETYRDR